jgi:hypothetical protein
MHRAALKRVVKILAMCGGAVDEGGAGCVERARMPDRRARAVVVAAGERAADLVLVARGGAEADDIDQKVFAFARGCGRERTRLQSGNFRRQRFSDGSLRQLRHQTRNSFV